jgi:hypothetical protein
MLRRSLVSLVLVLAVASSLSAFQDGEWVKLAPTGEGFSVMMPGTPKEEKRVEGNYSSHSFAVRTDIAMYLFEYGDNAPTLKIDPAQALAVNRDTFVRAFEGTLIESREISLDGHPGLEFRAENSRMSAKCRFFAFGNRLYFLVAGINKPQDDSANVNRFFASFAFTKTDPVHKP